jgi:hypothetical protein
VRVGRKLVPTPREFALRERVHGVVEGARSIFQPGKGSNLANTRANFTIRTQGSNLVVGGRLLSAVHTKTPYVELRFITEGREDAGELRDGRVDLEIGNTG